MTERRQRLWLTFAVGGSLKWLGHLGLFRAWERVLRRAGLPLLYSKGFNPRPRMAIAFPLPVGFTGEEELLDLLLTRPVPPLEVIHRLRPQLPAGLTLRRVEEVDLRAPSLQSQLQAAEYIVRLPARPADLNERVRELLAAESCPRERRGRRYDLRPLIRALSVKGSYGLRMVLQAGDRGTGRPDEVLLALGLDPRAATIHRRKLCFIELGSTCFKACSKGIVRSPRFHQQCGFANPLRAKQDRRRHPKCGLTRILEDMKQDPVMGGLSHQLSAISPPTCSPTEEDTLTDPQDAAGSPTDPLQGITSLEEKPYADQR